MIIMVKIYIDINNNDYNISDITEQITRDISTFRE